MQQEPIAIIGMGCRFPGADTLQAFWKLLREGKDAIREVPADRWNIQELYDADPTLPGKMSSRWGGFLDQVDQFDWHTFRILPREAKYIDPQHRLLLEVTWEALEDAGIPFAQVAENRTSVSIGISWNDYLRLQSRNWSKLDGYTAVGNPYCFAANRISYVFDLKGPSISLDTGCASSLTATYLACQSLWTGEATLALAGGVNLMLSPDSTIMMSKARLLSADGRCKTLDARADGFVRGEGAGVIILKPLAQVLPSDRVYAVIRSVAINHNGHNEWIMAASTAAQEVLLRDAYCKAGVDPAEVDYVELHGTGFLRGDRIETKALGNVLGASSQRKRPCLIGSLKTNMGNLESASGIASVIKVALSLYHREIPPTLHLQTLNPEISLSELHLAVQQTHGPWPDKEGTPLAGVTALAFTGANAHVVLAASPVPVNESSSPGAEHTEQVCLLPVSARSQQALFALASAFKDFLLTEETRTRLSWKDICYTASVRRSHHEYRTFIAARSSQEAAALLDASLQEKISSHMSSGSATPSQPHKLVFLFAHQRSPWSAMQDECLNKEASFQTTVEECARLFRQVTGKSLWEELNTSALSPRSGRVVSHPIASFTLQVALAALWQSWGILPDAVLGEGMGEVAAAYVAGALTLEEALCVVSHSQQDPSSSRNNGTVLADIRLRPTAIPLYSATVGLACNSDDDKGLASCWQKTLYKPNLSVAVVDQLLTESYDVFIDLGSYSVLSGAILARQQCQEREGTLLPSLQQAENAGSAMLRSLGTLYTLGYEVNWSALHTGGGRCISLVTYPWQRERLWLDWLDVEEVSTPPEYRSMQHLQEDHTDHLPPDAYTHPSPLLRQLAAAPATMQRDILLAHVQDQVMSVLELDPTYLLKSRQKLFALGMDSLTAAQLVSRLQVSLRCSLPATLIFHYPTVESLSDYLAREVLSLVLPARISETEQKDTHEQEALMFAEVKELSESATEALLIEKLAAIERRFE